MRPRRDASALDECRPLGPQVAVAVDRLIDEMPIVRAASSAERPAMRAWLRQLIVMRVAALSVDAGLETFRSELAMAVAKGASDA